MKTNKNTIKHYRRPFLYKSNKMQKKNQWWNVLHIHVYGVTYAEIKTLKLSIILKSDQNIA